MILDFPSVNTASGLNIPHSLQKYNNNYNLLEEGLFFNLKMAFVLKGIVPRDFWPSFFPIKLILLGP
jgi:hypothetical protein